MSKGTSHKNISWFALCLLLIAACSRDRNHPGYEYFGDMSRSGAYEYYSENPNFPDGKTAQAPVKGSIPRGEVPYQYPSSVEGQALAGKELVNPVGYSEDNIKIGQAKFEKYCSMCHGISGKGDGHLVTDKKFVKDMPPLNGDYVQAKPDGEIFHVITKGSVSGFMGSHSWQLDPVDRWRIVSYIKHGLRATNSNAIQDNR